MPSDHNGPSVLVLPLEQSGASNYNAPKRLIFSRNLRIISARVLQRMPNVQQMVERIQANAATSEEELLPLVYEELRVLARKRLSREMNSSLQTTELVHEAYLRLVGSNTSWEGRAHFFAAAAEAMRRVLVDRARRKQRVKHGGGRKRVALHDSAIEAGCRPEEVIAVNELFDHLARSHPVEADLAKLRYFAGFNLSEAASALNISIASAHKYWMFARAWLYREYTKG